MVSNLLRLALLAAVTLSLTACRTMPSARTVMVSAYKPSNVFYSVYVLPPTFKRVAVLPMTRQGLDSDTETGIETLEPILAGELRKSQAFELVFPTRAQIRDWTGRDTWNAADELPPKFFARLQESTGCDGVVFARLTMYRPYPPLAIGWNLALVGCEKANIMWSIDEVFDGGSLPIIRGAEAYCMLELNSPEPALDGPAILQSPRRFGQYTAHVVAGTLPTH